MATTYKNPIAFHPGEYLREWLEENNMTSKELALRLGGKPEKTISNILTGKSAITPEMAEALSYVTSVPSHMWNNLQAKYNGYLASQTIGDAHEAQWDTWGACFPYKEMVKRGWIPDLSSLGKGEKVRQLLAFLGISHSSSFEMIYGDLLPQFRLTKGASHDPYATAVWLRQGQILAKQRTLVGQFDREQVEQSIHRLKEVLMDANQSKGKLEELASELGIALIILPQLPKASISGVAMWVGGTPTIVLSGKGKRHDMFVFNFFHELGHILLHRGRNQQARIFVDDASESVSGSKEELEANNFASDLLIPASEIAQCSLTKTAISQLARRYKVHPCVVLGRLVREKRISWELCNSKYKDLNAQTILPFQA